MIDENAELKKEIQRLRAMLPQTVDGVLVIDCEKLYCPKCFSEMSWWGSSPYCECLGEKFSRAINEIECYSRPEAARESRK